MLSSPTTEGEKRVYGKVFDEAGNEVVTDDVITLDLTTPAFDIEQPYGIVSNAKTTDGIPMITLSLAIDSNSLSGLARSELGIYAGLGSLTCDELQTNGHTVTLTEDSDLFDVTVVNTETPQTICVCVVKPWTIAIRKHLRRLR